MGSLGQESALYKPQVGENTQSPVFQLPESPLTHSDVLEPERPQAAQSGLRSQAP